jgi:hypothetical protein
MLLHVALALALTSAPGALGEGETESPPWPTILGPAQGRWPEPEATLRWRASLDAASAEARATGRPLLVVLRCLPCKQCSRFDADVLAAEGELDPLLRRFVTVRLTDAAALDLRVFPVEGFQDLDLSWWAWLLAPDLAVYAVFGGRDEVSDETRISVPALAATLRRVLDHHSDPRRSEWALEDPPGLEGDALSPTRLPGHEAWARAVPERDACLHCHQVAEILRQPALDLGTFDKRRDLEVWPLPENVGLELERDHGLRVSAVRRGSPAETAGLRAGDELAAASGRRLFGQTDLRAALHRGPRDAGTLALVWTRAGAVHAGELALADGWRATVLDWRMSVSQGNVGAGPGFFPLAVRAPRRAELGLAPGTLAVEPFFGPDPTSPAWQAGLRGSDVIVAVDGASPDKAGRAFLVWFRQQHEPGDEATFTVVAADGARRDVVVRLGSH